MIDVAGTRPHPGTREIPPTTTAAGAPEPASPVRESFGWGGASASIIAALAFGRADRSSAPVDLDRLRHLALLPADALALDLSDPAQRRFGDYELLELIGEGGMGVVYRAYQASLDREVAIKRLAAGPWASREFVERFLREARNAARMQHPNIVTIHEVGTVDHIHFFSMRLVRGRSLSDAIGDAGWRDLREAARLMRIVAEAVDYAHRLGVLHLDLKPGNILLDEHGVPHVADFGLARRLDGALASDEAEICGTPDYMAPEQAAGGSRPLSAATDLWGLGAILHELATGQPPFRAASAREAMRRLATEPLSPPRRLRADLPRDLEAIILKCLAREPECRYASARALADDLGCFAERRAVAARPLAAPLRLARWTRREPRLAAASALALAALLGGLLATARQWQRADRNAQVAAASEGLANERLWQTRRDQAAGAVRDGRGYDALPALAANIAEREAAGLSADEDRLRFAAIERNAPRLIDVIATGAPIVSVALSPDGKAAAVAGFDGTVRVFDLDSGRLRWSTGFAGLTHFWKQKQNLVALRFSGDGRRLIGRSAWPTGVVVAPFGIDEILFDAADGRAQVPPPERFADFRDATWSPDGRYAMVRSNAWEAVLMRADDWHAFGPRRRVPDAGWLLAPDARALAAATDGFTTLELRDPKTFDVRHRFRYRTGQRITAWAASPDGEALAVGHLDGLVELVDFAHGRRERVPQGASGSVSWLEFSADGRWFGAIAGAGGAMVWNRRTLEPVTPPMRPDGIGESPSARIALDAANGSVLATIGAQASLWRVHGADAAPQRIGTQFPHPGAFSGGVRPVAFEPARGLVATGGSEGELRLWRLPAGAARPLRDAAYGGDWHGSAQVVAVDETGVRLADVRSGAPSSAPLRLAQAPSFARMTDDAKTLVVAVADELVAYGRDGRDWLPRVVAARLPNDIVRVVLGPDSRRAFVAWRDYRDGREIVAGRVVDLRGGDEGGGTTVPEAVDDAFFSADGRILLLRYAGGLAALDASTLAPRWRTAGAEAVIAAGRFSAAGDSLWALVRSEAGRTALWRVDADGGAIADRSDLGELAVGNCACDLVATSARTAILQRAGSGPTLWSADGGNRNLAGYGVREATALALAPDARTFARATKAGVVLASAADGQWLSPELPAAGLASDSVDRLAFTPDGSGLVGRSARNQWLYWDVTPERRPAQQLLRMARRLYPDAARPPGEPALQLSARERAELRASDPGEPPAAATAPDPAIPTRRDDLAATLVDFGTQPQRPLQQPGRTPNAFKLDLPGLAPGRHRLLGVDYDVRSHLLAKTKNLLADGIVPQRLEGIRPDVAHVAALDVLLAATTQLQTERELPYAFVEIRYRDGSDERLPILYRRDVLAQWIDEVEPATARTAWRQADSHACFSASRVFAVRLVNPHPRREVASLALAASDHEWSQPAFLAITVEPAPAAAPAPPRGADRAD